MLGTIKDFLKLESTSGILLVLAAVLAMVVANSPAADIYGRLITMPVEVRVGPAEIAKPLLLWINDGLMVLFFFLVGLELKREFLVGELSRKGSLALPAFGAVGGMLIPGLIYAWINWNEPVALQGWAIPAATDIAFALAILALLGDRVPVALKVLLTSIAIFDDIGAIVIIALFYTKQLSLTSLIIALACLPVLYFLNRRGVVDTSRYVLIGLIMWAALLKSGVHATLTGVLLALFIPMKDPKNPERSPVMDLEHDLHTAVAFGVLPVFAFVNAGIDLGGVSMEYVLHPVPLGIIAGLFLGKQLGVWIFCRLGAMLGLYRLPRDLDWRMIYGVSLLCGVGFTMSLFIGSLAFEETGVNRMFDERLGIIIGSLLSGIVGYVYLRMTLPPTANGSRHD
ncbi:MAG: Na+/H+ antiporter NhaA [Gammaproteobacteria bacterium]